MLNDFMGRLKVYHFEQIFSSGRNSEELSESQSSSSRSMNILFGVYGAELGG